MNLEVHGCCWLTEESVYGSFFVSALMAVDCEFRRTVQACEARRRGQLWGATERGWPRVKVDERGRWQLKNKSRRKISRLLHVSFWWKIQIEVDADSEYAALCYSGANRQRISGKILRRCVVADRGL